MLSEQELNEIRNDLIRGIKMNKVVATEHYVNNPEKIIFIICKLAIKKNNSWIFRDEILYALSEEFGDNYLKIIRNGRRVNSYLISENGNFDRKWNAVDWFSKHFTDIHDKKRILKHNIIPRWYQVLERNEEEHKKISGTKWKYKIKEDYLEFISKTIDDFKNNPDMEYIEPKKTIPIQVKSKVLNSERESPILQKRKILYQYFEKDVEEKLLDKLDKLELTIYEDDTKGRTGRQFDTFEVGRMDILCKDKEGNFVVIELKKGNANEQVISQIQRYMGWIHTNLAKEGQKVKGIILTERHDRNLEYAARANPSISIKHYKVNIEIID